MLPSMLSVSNKKLIQVEKIDFIQDIQPITYNVDFKSLENGEVFDYSDITYNQISEFNIFRKSDKEVILCIAADGSEHSEFCLRLVTEEFIPQINTKENIEAGKIAKYLAAFIYFSTKDKEFNYKNAKDNVISNYSEMLGYHRKNGVFYTEDRWSKKHAIHQICIHAALNKSNMLFVGFVGIKGPKGENNELIKGIDYLLGYCTTPVMIIKENVKRSKTKTGGFNWLIVLEKNHVNRIKLLEMFSVLIDKEKDTVYGYGLYEGFVPSMDTVKSEFEKYCEVFGIKKIAYDACYYKNGVADVISERVNFGKERFDFVCFYNNVSKHLSNPNDNDYSNLVKKCSSNIGFINI